MDPELHNFIRTAQGVVVIDFDFAELHPCEADNGQDLEELKGLILEKINGQS
jgi:thiamine kinase-like enzyme